MKYSILILTFALIAVTGFPQKGTFVKASQAEWSTVQLRDDITFEKAWGEVLDILAKRFEMEMISKDGGYGRTSWIYDWSTPGTKKKVYKVRVIFKFSADHSKVDIKADAEKLGKGGTWITGYDTKLMESVKTDIMGIVGRTAK
jgi:hypothetical protein